MHYRALNYLEGLQLKRKIIARQPLSKKLIGLGPGGTVPTFADGELA